jgi:long-chain acyl-CoA synthetase
MDAGSEDLPGTLGWEKLLAAHSPLCPAFSAEPDDGASIIYTSGTTGRPKGVVLTHGNVVSNTASAKVLGDHREDDRSLCFLPIYHSFGQNFIMNAVIRAGGTLVLHKKFDVEEILDSLRDNRVTRFYGVPPVYIKILEHPRAGEAMRTVRYCFSAAASMPAEVARRWRERFGVAVHEGYGLTETTPAATYNHATRWKPGSVGTAIPDVRVRVVDAQGRETPAGTPGEIQVRGPNVMKGYFGKPEETAAALSDDGWLRTGDVGYLDEEGYLFLVDRVKDMINASGLKVWPREVEEVLYRHPAVRECAVIGVPHPVYGETVKALVALRVPGAATADELREWVRQRLADYKAPRLVDLVDELPKNVTGKILKEELRRRERTS